jgi:hypothetical protein
MLRAAIECGNATTPSADKVLLFENNKYASKKQINSCQLKDRRQKILLP